MKKGSKKSEFEQVAPKAFNQKHSEADRTVKTAFS
jgi:hypothetical protein